MYIYIYTYIKFLHRAKIGMWGVGGDVFTFYMCMRYILVYIYMYINMSIRYIHMYIYVHMYIYMYIDIHIYI